MKDKKLKDARAKQIGDGINKKIIDKGRMINKMQNEKMKAKTKKK